MSLQKKYDTVIFDLDGTLLDTLDDLTNSTNYALRQMRFSERSREEVRRFVGNGVRKLIERAVPQGTSEEDIKKALEIFKEHYSNNSEVFTKPYNGMIELLDELIAMGFHIAVVSNKIDHAVKSLCQKYFGTRILLSVGDRDGIAKKPSPDMVNEVLAQLYVHPFETVYIGDSEVDIETAQNASTDCVSVTWGFRDQEFLIAKGAKILAHKPSDIFSLLVFDENSPNIQIIEKSKK